MNSITYGIGYFLAILVVNVFSTEYTLLSEKKVTRNSPFNFGYVKSENFLLMEITLKNIPPSVTAVYLKDNQYYKLLEPKGKEANIEKQTSEVKFMILKHLIYNKIVVDVELYSQQELCDTTNIAEGRDTKTLQNTWISHYQKYVYQYNQKQFNVNGDCLVPKPCEIVVDLKNKCPDYTGWRDIDVKTVTMDTVHDSEPPAKKIFREQPATTSFSCKLKESQYICTFTKQQNTLKYRFYQNYNYSSLLGPAPEMAATVTIIYIQLELFDINTSVGIFQNKKPIDLWSKNLTISAKDISKDDRRLPTLKYSEKKKVEYGCQERNNRYEPKYIVHVGLINTDNKIKTYNKTSIKKLITMAENGTILCCLYYKTNSYWQAVHITRVVENKTLLIYQSDESISTNPTESKGQTKTPQTGWLIYLVPLFLGICVVMLALYIIKQKRCCQKSHPAEETVELDNHATQNQVLYANLDFVRDEDQPQGQHEEPHYANIVGVLHPLSIM